MPLGSLMSVPKSPARDIQAISCPAMNMTRPCLIQQEGIFLLNPSRQFFCGIFLFLKKQLPIMKPTYRIIEYFGCSGRQTGAPEGRKRPPRESKAGKAADPSRGRMPQSASSNPLLQATLPLLLTGHGCRCTATIHINKSSNTLEVAGVEPAS